jgi:hypothetical protein
MTFKVLEMDTHLLSTVAEVKADFQCVEAREIIDRYAESKFSAEAGPPTDCQHDFDMYTLLLYRFCHLLIVLLEGQTSIVEATSSTEAISSATLVLELVRTLWLTAGGPYNGRPIQERFLSTVPRILWLSGLQFPNRVSPAGNPPPNRAISHADAGVVSKLIVHQIEASEEPSIARCLEQFWESMDIKYIHKLLSQPRDAPGFPLWRS